MDIEDIEKSWTRDSNIDDTQLDLEALKIPVLHSRYLNIYNAESKEFHRNSEFHKILVNDKAEYYLGNMCQEDLDQRGWAPFNLKVLKQDLQRYIESDRDIIKEVIKLADQRNKLETLKSILNTINNRSFHIQNAINWRKFTNGIN